MASVSQAIRERFLAGEVLNQSDLAKEYGCSSSLGALVRKTMTNEGHKFKSSTRMVENRQFTDWRLAGSTPKSTPKEEAVAETTEVKQRQNGQAPLPVLGQTVTVSLLSMSDSGVVSLGLRDGKRVWLCQLVGETK
jgi:hypothetical protein